MASKKVRRAPVARGATGSDLTMIRDSEARLNAARGTGGLIYGQTPPKGNLSGDVIQRTVPSRTLPANRSPTLSGAVPSKPGDTLTPGTLTTYGSGRQKNTTSNARAGLKFRTFTRADRPGMQYHEYMVDGKRRVVGVKTKT